MPQKAEVLKKGKIKNTDDVNKISTKLIWLKFFFKVKLKIKNMKKHIIVFDSWKFTILSENGLRNALNPVVTAVSGWFASMLAGAVFVEYIFAWNGIGKEIVDALNNLDLPVVMGAVLFIASIFVFINIVVDIIYGILDPRIRIT